MAHNKLNRHIQCNTITIYSRKDEYKSFTKNNKELNFMDDEKNELNMEDINCNAEEKTMNCNNVNKTGLVLKLNPPTETSGNTRFLNSAVSGTDTNCNVVATELSAVLETFPFSCYRNLKYLNLSNAKISSLPENMNVLNNLYLLDLSSNYLTDLPESLADLHKLRLLNLSNNKFTELPSCLLRGLQILKYLNISHNIIKSLHNPPLCLSFLQTLILSNVMLIELPIWFWNRNCHLLNHLNLSGNICFSNLNYINKIKNLHYRYPSVTKNVTSLDISNCAITNIEFLSEFKNIRFLNVGNRKAILRNSLMELPMSIFAEPNKLVELHVDDVGLSVLPDKIYLFTSLKVLNAPNNCLSWLPENFNQLRSLEVLNLKSNKLLYLSNGLDTLTHLKELYLSENQLTSIRKYIEELTNIEVLDLYNNFINEIPISTRHLNKLKSFDMEYNKIDSDIIQETGLMAGNDYMKLKQRLRENLICHRHDGVRIDSSSVSSEPSEEDDGDNDDSHLGFREYETEDEACANYSSVYEESGCQSELNKEAKEEDWEKEEYWDVYDSDEDWDPETHDQQKKVKRESYEQWKTSVLNSKPAAFPHCEYNPASDLIATRDVFIRDLSEVVENQFDD